MPCGKRNIPWEGRGYLRHNIMKTCLGLSVSALCDGNGVRHKRCVLIRVHVECVTVSIDGVEHSIGRRTAPLSVKPRATRDLVIECFVEY